jgi:hypothetical protein
MFQYIETLGIRILILPGFEQVNKLFASFECGQSKGRCLNSECFTSGFVPIFSNASWCESLPAIIQPFSFNPFLKFVLEAG